MAFGKATTWTDDMLDRAFAQIEARFVELESELDGDGDGEQAADPRETQLRDVLLSILPGMLQGLKSAPPAASPGGNGGKVV